MLSEQLGQAQRELPDRDGVVAAIESFERAARAFAETDDHEGFVRCSFAAADLYFGLAPGPAEELGANLTRAIDHYRAATAASPVGGVDWIRGKLSLGPALIGYAQIIGSRDVPEALTVARQVLRLDPTPESALARGAAHLLSGQAIRQAGRTKGGIERAIVEFKLALKGPQQPRDEAATQLALGAAYMDRLGGLRSRNVELGIDYYEAAQASFAKLGLQFGWMQTEQNLGIAYLERALGDPVANIEDGLDAIETAKQFWEVAGEAARLAEAQALLGHGNAVRLRGSHRDNVECAIANLHAATKVQSRTLAPGLWARRQFDLGIAYWKRVAGDPSWKQRRALVHLRRALASPAYAGVPADAGAAWNAVGALLPGTGGGTTDIARQALCAFRRARTAYRDQPEQRGGAAYNAAVVLLADSSITGQAGERRVLRALKRALTDLPAAGQSPYRGLALKELGDLHLRAGRWSRAWVVYDEAMRLSAAQSRQAASVRGDLIFAERRRGLHANAAYCSLKLGQRSRALGEIEAGLAQTLREGVAGEGRMTASAADSGVRKLRRRIALQEQMVEASDGTASDRSDQRDALQRSRDALDALLRRKRWLNLDRTNTGPLIDTGTIEATVIVPIVTPVGSAAIVLPPRTESVEPKHVIWMGLTTVVLDAMLSGSLSSLQPPVFWAGFRPTLLFVADRLLLSRNLTPRWNETSSSSGPAWLVRSILLFRTSVSNAVSPSR